LRLRLAGLSVTCLSMTRRVDGLSGRGLEELAALVAEVAGGIKAGGDGAQVR
jgi:hypothetical protein